ncbi:M23 family metallopeptidase [Sulfurisoma sediminicola]|uniref:Peptidase M23-like protein n=1 Tax=Sulfurisoma sediminicola TaxID=1381557 RepID=A0A497XCS0_9PROT|nr:M23 family metallopeptidase [Sulfurisoma sediminicola]RLJ64733.1 peptidase M23-like protein [Sulfurisoma sediminicola]
MDCFIQNFYDHDPGPGARDYACGSLTYDGHTGTDFRLIDASAMEAGVPVLAAADGVVVALRDGEPDISIKDRGREALKGKDAGNGVRIDHGDGWETQYSHLERGSIAVRRGQRVKAGQVLGRIGLSGNTEFPHVDFAVRHRGRPLDPFAPASSDCGDEAQGLWAQAVRAQLKYRPTGLLIAGFATQAPRRENAEGGLHGAVSFPRHAEALAFWVELFGLRAGDRLELTLTDPDGRTVAAGSATAPRHQAVWFGSVGHPRAAEDLRPGRYEGRITLRREGTAVIEASRSAEVR